MTQSNYSSKIYNSLIESKKMSLTTQFVDVLSYPITFSKIYYKGDYFESVPFGNILEETICRLLLHYDSISIDELGKILGFNIEHAPNEGKYRDDAEVEILRNSLKGLAESKNIFQGDNFFSAISLTKMGKACAKIGKKVKHTENKAVEMYLDHFANQNEYAKKWYKNVAGKEVKALYNRSELQDEKWQKDMLKLQSPEMSKNTSNDWSNLQNMELQIAQTLEFDLDIVYLFDFENNDWTLEVYEPQTETLMSDFTKMFNENAELKQRCLKALFEGNRCKKMAINPIQASFMQNMQHLQQSIDTLLSAGKYQQLPQIDTIYLQQKAFPKLYFEGNLTKMIPKNATEIWLFFPYLTRLMHDNVSKMAKENGANTNVYLAYNSADKGVEKQTTAKNMWILAQENITQYEVWTVGEKSFCYTETSFYYEYESQSFEIEMYEMSESKVQDKTQYHAIKEAFLNKYLPHYQENMKDKIKKLKPEDISKEKIKELNNLDATVQIWANMQHHIIVEMRQEKEEFIAKMKDFLREKLQESYNQQNELLQKEGIKQWEMRRILEDLKVLLSKCLEEYSELRISIVDTLEEIKAQLDRKTYILDTNILIDNPNIIKELDSNDYIIIPAQVIDELDRLKTQENTKLAAAEAIRMIKEATETLSNVRIEVAQINTLPKEYQRKIGDNHILAIAFLYKEENGILLTNDNNLHIKAKSLGVKVELRGKRKISVIPKSIITSNTENLPKNKHTGKAISLEILKKAYNKAKRENQKEATTARFAEMLKNEMPLFDCKNYGFAKFIDFCKSLKDFSTLRLGSDNKTYYIQFH